MKRFIVWFLAFVVVLISFGTFPSLLRAQLFQNNNSSCEDLPVIGEIFAPEVTPPFSFDAAITCGRFTDDTALGHPDFPDCGTVADVIPNSMDFPAPDTNSILINSGAHGQNCVNAGEPNNQFLTPVYLQNSDLTPVADGAAARMGSIVHGNLAGSGLEDLAMVFTFNPDAPIASQSVAELFNTGSGFGPPLDTGSALLEPGVPVPLRPFPVDYFGGPAPGGNFASDRSLVLLNCDGDNLDEGVVVAADTTLTDFPVLVVMQNSGAGLEDGSDFISLPITGDDNMRSALAAGDFDGDGILDLAVVVSVHQTDVPSVFICQGNGVCSFTCPSDLTDPNVAVVGDPAESPDPSSIVAGDVDGDTDVDIVITENDQVDDGTGEFDIRYFFNNGGGLNSWPTQAISFRAPGDTTSLAPVLTLGRFSTEAVQMGIDEVAVNNAHGGLSALFSAVQVITTDGAMGLSPPVALAFSPPLPPMSGRLPFGIEAKDVDHCGGDDIVALSVALTPPATIIDSTASLFLNTNEPPVVTIDPNVSTELRIATPRNIPTTCTDPTFDDRTFQWVVVSQPAGANVIFGTPSGSLTGLDDDVSTTFEADQVGSYTLRVDCTDFCGLTDDDPNQVQIIFDVLAPPQPLTQGATLFNCHLNSESNGKGNPMIWTLLLMLPAVILLHRLGRKRWFIPTLLVLLIAGLASPGQALTNSVYVNTFAPTVDDSEYFTVYNSPTMLQRNYHAGFYLDYAHDPYEFGDTNFNRVSGIVDHLLDANIVGAYGVFNWMSVGLVIPVTLYEGLNSPLLNLNESNFALGDVSLVLKFRLLNREKHHVGIAIVPFFGFPTSTNSTDFLGNGGFSGGATLVIDGRIKDRVSIALNVGGNIRQQFIDVSGQDIDDQFLASLGITVDIIKKTFKWIGEVQSSTVFKNFYSDRRTTPAEARVGFRYTWANNHDINAGMGMGFSNGIGQPDVRGFIGYTYTKRPLAEVELPPPPISEINVGDELTLKDKIYFEFDKDKIRDISMPTLDKIAAFLKAHPEVTKIKIDGYTCDLGSTQYNLGLSQRRSRSAAQYLEGQGVDPSRIGMVTGFGEENPLVPNVDEAHREQNRRVQIFVEAVDPSLITGASAPAAAEPTE